MKSILSVVDQLNWVVVIILCVTIGLAPFSPPHIIEKLSMLIKGNLIKPLDWFDLLLHGFPWIILVLKLTALLIKKI
ncbi:MAG: RND transporter [Desulfobacterium sp.]|nr:RND transporter [Desulfobacterium sp.]MBU3948402.1 RND transporter [Pseudomonadota bacterium]MBU4037156.1 RND transporter [Pseudomonadota bacterium]